MNENSNWESDVQGQPYFIEIICQEKYLQIKHPMNRANLYCSPSMKIGRENANFSL